MTISPTYSSTAPTGWNQLPPEGKQKFYDIASKGDWNAHEAYDHLVPDHLKDNPDEVMTWMDGGTVTVETDVYHQGRGGVQTETVEVEIPDRDVSRIEAGGDYSPENTIMEDMSINRSRGDLDMTASELEAAEAANSVDAGIIESSFDSGVESVVEVASESTSLIGDIGETLVDGLLPAVGAVKAATYVAGKCETTQDKLGWGALAGGGAAWLLTTPIGLVAAGAYGGYKLTQLGFKLFDRMNQAA